MPATSPHSRPYHYYSSNTPSTAQIATCLRKTSTNSKQLRTLSNGQSLDSGSCFPVGGRLSIAAWTKWCCRIHQLRYGKLRNKVVPVLDQPAKSQQRRATSYNIHYVNFMGVMASMFNGINRLASKISTEVFHNGIVNWCVHGLNKANRLRFSA